MLDAMLLFQWLITLIPFGDFILSRFHKDQPLLCHYCYTVRGRVDNSNRNSPELQTDVIFNQQSPIGVVPLAAKSLSLNFR